MEFLILIWYSIAPGLGYLNVAEAKKAKHPEYVESHVEIYSTTDTAKLMERVQSIGVRDFDIYRGRKGQVQLSVDLGR